MGWLSPSDTGNESEVLVVYQTNSVDLMTLAQLT